jgi:hypothetical protein
MERLIPILAAAQWIVGVLLALVAVGRSRRHGRAGVAPRMLARLSIVVFILAAVVVLLASTTASRFVAGWLPTELASARWRLGAIIQPSLIAWALLALSGLWNWILGVSLRRRTAATELRRRTERVMAHRAAEPHPSGPSRASATHPPPDSDSSFQG